MNVDQFNVRRTIFKAFLFIGQTYFVDKSVNLTVPGFLQFTVITLLALELPI